MNNNLSSNLPKAWLLLAYGEEQTYFNQTGYKDVIQEVYQYDNFVRNYKNISTGDLIVIRNKAELLGLAKIEVIEKEESTKERKRCPKCNTTRLVKRTTKTPIFRCKNEHEFDEPIHFQEPCTKFSVHFKNTFVNAKGVLSLKQLTKACPKFNQQLAMQLIDLNQIKSELLSKVPEIKNLFDNCAFQNELNSSASDEGSYTPNSEDRRKAVLRQIKERRGQQAFRDALRRHYGDRCMVTESKIIHILEAAHISPYRGEEDNSQANGLLLRTDIHTLFDLDLLGIEPQSLTVRLNPNLLGTEYEIYEGKQLNCSTDNISREALQFRWDKFLVSLKKRSGNLYN